MQQRCRPGDADVLHPPRALNIDLRLSPDPAGEGIITSTRSARRAASRTLCVTNTIVSPRVAQMCSVCSCMASRVIASSAAKGSSIRRI